MNKGHAIVKENAVMTIALEGVMVQDPIAVWLAEEFCFKINVLRDVHLTFMR